MSMKKAQLEKFLAKKVEGAMRRESTHDRYGAASGQVHDKREQRRRDQEAGLVPFAVKLPQALVSALQERSRSTGASLNDVVADLLREALGAKDVAPVEEAPDKAAPKVKPAAAKPAAKATSAAAKAAASAEPSAEPAAKKKRTPK